MSGQGSPELDSPSSASGIRPPTRNSSPASSDVETKKSVSRFTLLSEKIKRGTASA